MSNVLSKFENSPKIAKVVVELLKVEKGKQRKEEKYIPWTERTYAQSLYKTFIESENKINTYSEPKKWDLIEHAFRKYASLEWDVFLVRKNFFSKKNKKKHDFKKFFFFLCFLLIV